MTGHVHVRLSTGDRDGHPEWLQLIWECNELAFRDLWERDRPGDNRVFGAPEIGPWWAGGTVEEYPDARVIHRGDGTVSVVGKTERGDRMISLACDRLGYRWTPTVTLAVTT